MNQPRNRLPQRIPSGQFYSDGSGHNWHHRPSYSQNQNNGFFVNQDVHYNQFPPPNHSNYRAATPNVGVNQQQNATYIPNQNFRSITPQSFNSNQQLPFSRPTGPPAVSLPPVQFHYPPPVGGSLPVQFPPSYSAVSDQASKVSNPPLSFSPLRLPPPSYQFGLTSPCSAQNFATYQNSDARNAGQFGVHLMPEFTPLMIRKTQREVDEEWISWWCENKEQKPASADVAASLSISEVKAILAKAVSLCKELGMLKDELGTMTSVSENEWQTKMQQVLLLKSQIQGLEKQLTDCSVVAAFKKKLKKRKQKRIRQRRKKREEKDEEEKKIAQRESLHRIIDACRNSAQQKVLEKKRNKEMQAEADSILAEVKRKINDTKRAQECTRVLEKLRQIRKENSQKKGLQLSSQCDEDFRRKILEVKELLQKQMDVYDAEEKALRVMMESEREEQRELEIAKKQQRIQEHIFEKKTDLLENLFGENVDLNLSHPLYFYWKYYTQAEDSLENLIQIRCQWDNFLAEGDNESSSVPIHWVVPSNPSSDMWTASLQ